MSLSFPRTIRVNTRRRNDLISIPMERQPSQNIYPQRSLHHFAHLAHHSRHQYHHKLSSLFTQLPSSSRPVSSCLLPPLYFSPFFLLSFFFLFSLSLIITKSTMPHPTQVLRKIEHMTLASALSLFHSHISFLFFFFFFGIKIKSFQIVSGEILTRTDIYFYIP